MMDQINNETPPLRRKLCFSLPDKCPDELMWPF